MKQHRLKRKNLSGRCWLGLIASCLMLASCLGEMPRATPEMLAVAERHDAHATTESLTAGRLLYVTRCGSCHGLSEPTAYQEGAWKKWVRRMAPKAHLDSTQETQMITYLLSARETLLAH